MIELKLGICLDLLKIIPENIYNLICVDMPYGTMQCKWDEKINLDLIWIELKKIEKDNAAIILFAQTAY